MKYQAKCTIVIEAWVELNKVRMMITVIIIIAITKCIECLLCQVLNYFTNVNLYNKSMSQAVLYVYCMLRQSLEQWFKSQVYHYLCVLEKTTE